MRRGFSVPIILVVIVVFVFIPLLYWQLISNRRSVSNVQGVSVSNSRYSVVVNSDVKSWDLFEYLCQSKSDCDKALLSGHFNQKISGGVGKNQNIKFISDVDLHQYTYVKLFMKPSWGLTGTFNLQVPQLSGASVEQLGDSLGVYNVLFIPISSLPDKEIVVATFSDH